MEERLDKVLMQRKLVSTRVRAEQIIQESGVLVNGKLINKPGKKIPVDASIELLGEEIPWVSRGALKLLKAIDLWKIDCTGKTVIDIGASTGGFTEVVLQAGASKVFAVDVGSKQLHPKLADHPAVINLEKTHVRELNNKLIPEPVQLAVIDVSFISLEKIFPFIHPILEPGATVIALVKPQFEVGREHLAKGGIVKNKALYPAVIKQLINNASVNQLEYVAQTESPVLGGDGNHEFLLLLKRKAFE